MKNYLISHIKRRVETFIKQAQESFSETTYAQILALLASHKDEEELKASMRNDTFRNLLSSLVAWTKNKDLKKANVKVHLDIKNFMAEMEDISSNPEIDETLADLVETDFYADFEEILLNILEHAEAVGELDTESEEYQKLQQASSFDIFKAEEDKFSNSIKRRGEPNMGVGGKEVMGAIQRCELHIEKTRDFIKDYNQTPELVKIGQDLLNLLINEKLPLCKEMEKIQNKLSIEGVDHFIKIDNLDPDSLKSTKMEPNSGGSLLENLVTKKMPIDQALEDANKSKSMIDPDVAKRIKVNPDGSYSKRSPKTFKIVNPEYAEKLFPVQKAISKITQRAIWMVTLLKRDGARYFLVSGQVPDSYRVDPKLMDLYKKISMIKFKIEADPMTISKAGLNKKITLTKALDYFIDNLLKSKDNPFDPNAGAHKMYMDVIQHFEEKERTGKADLEWRHKAKGTIDRQQGKLLGAALNEMQQMTNNLVAHFGKKFFRDILFKTYLESRGGDFSEFKDYVESLEKIYALKQEFSSVSEKFNTLNEKVRASRETKIPLTNEELNVRHNAEVRLKQIAKVAAALEKGHAVLIKNLGKSITSMIRDIASGNEVFQDEGLNNLAGFLRTLYQLRDNRNKLHNIVKETIEHVNLTSKELDPQDLTEAQIMDCLNLLAALNDSIEKMESYPELAEYLDNYLTNIKNLCKEAESVFFQKVPG